MNEGIRALHTLVSHIETESGSDDYYEVRCARDTIEEELRVLEILRKYKWCAVSFQHLLFRKDYWESKKEIITDELLRIYDIPYTVDEFKTITGWLRSKEKLE